MKRPYDPIFIKNRIQDLRTALFFNLGSSVLKFSTCIVTALKADEEGNIWFFVPMPKQNLEEFDREFLTRLDFFRKGKLFFLSITGRAALVHDHHETDRVIGAEFMEEARRVLVLVRVNILHADYFEASERMELDWLSSVGNGLYTWYCKIARHLRRIFSLHPEFPVTGFLFLKRVFQHILFVNHAEKK